MILKKVLALVALIAMLGSTESALFAKSKKRTKAVEKEAVQTETVQMKATQSALECLQELAKLPLSELKKPENATALRNAYKAINRSRDYGRGGARGRVSNRPVLQAELDQLKQEFRDKL